MKYFAFIRSFCLLILINKFPASEAFYLGNDSLSDVCKIPDLKPWIYFQYDVCLHLVVDESEYPSTCITKLVDMLTTDGMSVYQKSLVHMQRRNISEQRKTTCESYLFVMENPEDWLHGIDRMNKKKKTHKIFYPFSRLYFLSLYAKDIRPFGSNIKNYFHRNALFGYKFMFDSDEEVVSIQDVQTSSTIESSPNFTDLSHSLLDRDNPNLEFTVSVYNCSPLIIYLDKNGSRKDGMDYRFLTHVLKNWKIRYLHLNESIIPFNPWTPMFNELSQGQSDMVMCGTWLNAWNSNGDLTSYFDNNCNTWIAPKPRKIDPATLIYLALSPTVWCVYFFCFVLTVILLTIISKIEENIHKTKIISSSFGRSMLEATNTATYHGITNIPQQISLQILLISWILLNLLVGLGYTTMYTSRLMSPGYTKPIETFEDFVDQGISWVSRNKYEILRKTLGESTNPAFNNMYENFVYASSEEELVKRLRTGRYGLFMSIRSQQYPVDVEHITHPSAEGIWDSFLFMKVCFLSQFSTFTLQRHSPFTALFNAHIRRYQECGIIKHWYADLYREYKEYKAMDTLFETFPIDDPNSLTLWDMTGAFFVLLIGLFTAMVAYLCEVAYVKLRKIFSNY